MAGKGDTYRPVNVKRFNENYERIFGKKEILNVWKKNEINRNVSGIKEKKK